MNNDLLTVRELCERARLPRTTVQSMICAGRLKTTVVLEPGSARAKRLIKWADFEAVTKKRRGPKPRNGS
jgi:hypothetical protein